MRVIKNHWYQQKQVWTNGFLIQRLLKRWVVVNTFSLESGQEVMGSLQDNKRCRVPTAFFNTTSLYRGETVDHNLGNFLIVTVGGHNAQPKLHCGRRYPDVIGGYRGVGLPQPIEDKCVSFSRFLVTSRSSMRGGLMHGPRAPGCFLYPDFLIKVLSQNRHSEFTSRRKYHGRAEARPHASVETRAMLSLFHEP